MKPGLDHPAGGVDHRRGRRRRQVAERDDAIAVDADVGPRAPACRGRRAPARRAPADRTAAPPTHAAASPRQPPAPTRLHRVHAALRAISLGCAPARATGRALALLTPILAAAAAHADRATPRPAPPPRRPRPLRRPRVCPPARVLHNARARRRRSSRCPALADVARPRRALGEGRDRALRPAGVQEPRRRVRGARAGRARRAGRRHHARLRQRRQPRPRRGAGGAARPGLARARSSSTRDVAAARVAAIAAEGADVVRVDGTYDDAVRDAAAHAAATGGLVVSDTSWHGYEQIPRDIMLGYTRLMDEAAAAWAGDGSARRAARAGRRRRTAGRRGQLVGVDLRRRRGRGSWPWSRRWPPACRPRRGPGARRAIAGPLTTVMAGLRCGEVSPLAFDGAAPLVDGYLAVDDAWTRAAMRRLAHPEAGDPPLAVGASGAAGLAALLALRQDPALAGVADAARPDAAPARASSSPPKGSPSRTCGDGGRLAASLDT